MKYLSIINRDRQFIIISLLIFRGLLDISYYFISTLYAYTGLGWTPKSLSDVLMSYIILIFIGLLIDISKNNLSTLLINLLIIFILVPSGTIFSYNRAADHLPFLIMNLFIICLIIAAKELPGRTATDLRQPVKHMRFFVLISLALTAVIVAQFGLPKSIPGLSNVYDIRAEYLEKSTRIYSYIIVWLTNVFCPLFIVAGLISKKHRLTLLGLFISLLMFSLTGHKTMVLSFFLIFWIVSGLVIAGERNMVFYVGSLSAVILLLLTIDANVSEVPWLTSIFIRRAFFVPGLLFYYYNNFFHHSPLDYWSQYFPFRLFMHSSYNEPISKVLGRYFFNENTNANVNFLGDAFANGGYMGYLVIFIAMLALLYMLNKITDGKDIYMSLAVVLFPFFMLTNTGFIPIFMTHGMLVSLVILYFLPKKNTL